MLASWQALSVTDRALLLLLALCVLGAGFCVGVIYGRLRS
jgi:hypothetical protein